MRLVAERRARTQPRIRSEHDVRAGRAAFDVRERIDARAGADRRIADHAVRADRHVVRERHAPFEHAVHVDRHIAAAFQRAAHVDARRVQQRHARDEQRVRHVALMNPLEFGELLLAVHAERFPLVVGLRGDDFDARFESRARPRRSDRTRPARCRSSATRATSSSCSRRRDDDAGVDLGDLPLVGARVLLLDDALHLAAAHRARCGRSRVGSSSVTVSTP